jgi:hypothetical protein
LRFLCWDTRQADTAKSLLSPTALDNTYKGRDGIWQYVNIDNGLQPGDCAQIILMGARGARGRYNKYQSTDIFMAVIYWQ